LPLANFPQHVRMARSALAPEKPLIAVIQAFDWSYYPEVLQGEAHLRAPTYEEIRCMVYEALACGANGIFFYPWDDGRWKMREHPDVWNALQRITAELHDRLPLFQSKQLWWARTHRFGNPEHRFNAALESSITSCRLFVADGNAVVPRGEYILAINNTEWRQIYSFLLPEPEAHGESTRHFQPRENRVELEMTPGLKSAEARRPQAKNATTGDTVAGSLSVVGEGRSAIVVSNWVTDDFERYAVHLYGPLFPDSSSGDFRRDR
jgi:hypothetical protein